MKILKPSIGRGNSPPINYKQIKNFTIKTLNKMKTIKTLFLATLLFTITTKAQLTKGNWMVGGSGSYNKYDGKDKITGDSGNGYSIITLNPNVGYFIIDKLALGTKLNFYSQINEDNANSSSKIGIGPFVRYYFLEKENRVNIFAQTSLDYNEFRRTYSNKTSDLTYSLKAGPVVYFNSSVALEMGLEYSRTNSFDSIITSLQASIGFQIHLKK